MFKNQWKGGQNHRNLGHFDPKIKEKNPNDGQNHRNLGPVHPKSKKKTPENAKIIENQVKRTQKSTKMTA